MTKHTPIPWRAMDRLDDDGHLCGVNIVCTIPDNENYIVAQTPDMGTLAGGKVRLYWPHIVANAAFIVLACNSHERLVKALKQLREDVMTDQAAMGVETAYDAQVEAKQQLAKAIVNADAAIAEAEEKP